LCKRDSREKQATKDENCTKFPLLAGMPPFRATFGNRLGFFGLRSDRKNG
jgi:hypothetical protein